MIIRRMHDVMRHPSKLVKYLIAKGILNWLDDPQFLRIRYRIHVGKRLNLDNPKTFNEKLQWLKLNDRRSEYTMMVDKYAVRNYIADTIGEEYLIPLLGVWDTPDEIDFDVLPEQFVLKCNHNSGDGMCICKDKSNLDIEKVKGNLRKGLKRDYFLTGREWPYKNVPRKVIAEKYMEDETKELRDYKIFVFSGKVFCIQVDYDRFTNHHRNFYSTAWEYIPFTTCYPTNPNKIIDRPTCLGEMMSIAEQLAGNAGKPACLRVDLYVVNGEPYFGELTFYHGSGFEQFMPEEWDQRLGEKILLTKGRSIL